MSRFQVRACLSRVPRDPGLPSRGFQEICDNGCRIVTDACYSRVCGDCEGGTVSVRMYDQAVVDVTDSALRRHRALVATARRHDLRPSTQLVLLSHQSPAVRAMAAGNTAIAYELVARMTMNDKDPEVRAARSARLDIPDTDLLAHLADLDPAVRRSAAGHPRVIVLLTGTQLRRLSQDIDPGVREVLAARPDLPGPLVRVLAGDTDMLVASAAARVHARSVVLDPYLLARYIGRVGGKKAAESWALPPRNRWNDVAANAPVGAPDMPLLALLGTRAFAVNRCLTSADPVVRAAALFNTTLDDAVRQSVAGRDRVTTVKDAAVRSQRLQNRFGGF